MFPASHIGEFTTSWYTLVAGFLNAIICTFYFIYLYRKKIGHTFPNPILYFVVSIITLIGFVGARILSVSEVFLISDHSHSFKDFMRLVLDNGGFSWYGGLLLILILIPILMKFIPRVTLLTILDFSSLVCCVAYAIGRLGCFLSGDSCYGQWTTLPWGMYFPYGAAPNILPVHPTPLYEILLHLVLLLFLIRLEKNKHFLGQVFCAFLFFNSFFRFFIEFIRINEKVSLGLTVHQFISLGLIIVSGSMYYFLSHTKVITYNSKSFQ
ncbi:MAG: prolipoprotein diacylglyceryl transferase [Bacteroidetes bacterium]|nr:prolipoprotein diacylglyceryl transferase [Bacteroidota bacterium]